MSFEFYRLNGIILNYKHVKVPEYLQINEDGSFVMDIVSDVYVFKPKIGNILKGMIYSFVKMFS